MYTYQRSLVLKLKTIIQTQLLKMSVPISGLFVNKTNISILNSILEKPPMHLDLHVTDLIAAILSYNLVM